VFRSSTISCPLLPALALALLLTPLAGCGGSGQGATSQPQHAVHGKVVSHGKPATGAIVVLHPADKANAGRFPPRGVTGKDGTFVIGSRLSSDGAPEGDYNVTILWPEEPSQKTAPGDTPPDRLKKRYNDPKNPKWKIHVVKGDNKLEDFAVE
jgi:hypothetical protein